MSFDELTRKHAAARLSFLIPKTAKGKSLRVKVTIKTGLALNERAAGSHQPARSAFTVGPALP